MVTCIVDCLIPRIIGILIGNLHLVVKSRISSRGWKLCEEPMKRHTSIQKIAMMICILRIVCIEVMTNHQFRHVLWAALRPIWTLRKFWYFLNFLSIYMPLNSRYSFMPHFVCDLSWIVLFYFLASVNSFANDQTIKLDFSLAVDYCWYQIYWNV